MCIFSTQVAHVSKTQIFARSTHGPAQYLAYQMTAVVESEVAMILPLPVPPSPSEDAVRFIDLSSYPDLSGHLGNVWDAVTLSRGPKPEARPLVIHAVGDFNASFVPTVGDFDRLDPRFRLPDGALRWLPRYADWGFAVFKLRALGAGGRADDAACAGVLQAHPAGSSGGSPSEPGIGLSPCLVHAVARRRATVDRRIVEMGSTSCRRRGCAHGERSPI